MASTLTFVCSRTNDQQQAGEPSSWSCTLKLEDVAIFGSSGTWSSAGPSPDKIFETRSGTWMKVGPNASLDPENGDPAKRVVLEGMANESGRLVGDGLVGGNFVEWKRT